jgi:SHAQKYF class myb-like DNA-binding protein
MDSKKDGKWALDEHTRFLEAIRLYGKNWKQVEDHVQTRTHKAILNHA